MVEQPHVHEIQRVPDAARDQLVGVARLGDARRVIMREDHGGGVALQGLLDDFARIDGRVIDRAPKQLIEGQDPVSPLLSWI